ncbi:uncharacterized protein LOC131610774 [Vicia villosa]|uniref:uncharacterized protein LOC131610774 n=1 Tax=Vicia villosa TaxID=3911 RepID=UPI00273A7A3B|nr:uncharacterized protein LOC131610774 [Vicia villosa]
MWCWCSNVVISAHATPCFKALVVPSVSASSLSQSRRLRQEPITEHQVGIIGHTLTANLESNSKPEKQQMNGSDVLWALQRATTRKKIIKNNKKKERDRGRDSSSAVSSMEENSMDYHVRPLCINDNWGTKLDELENRLRDLSDTT